MLLVWAQKHPHELFVVFNHLLAVADIGIKLHGRLGPREGESLGATSDGVVPGLLLFH